MHKSDSQSFRTGGQNLPRSDEQRSQISINAIFAVTQIALELEDPEVSLSQCFRAHFAHTLQITQLCVSMLIQRLRGTNVAVEAAVLDNLASLSPLLSEAEFASVVKAFSEVSRSQAAGDEDPRVVKSAVLTAQTRLAQTIDARPQRADMYLRELLELFTSCGLQLQQRPQNHSSLTAHMLALLPILDAVVSTTDYDPHFEPDEDLVNLFRNAWFLIVLLGFVNQPTTTSWQRASLRRIAAKTPCLVRGAAADYMQNDLEYNSVLRKDFVQHSTVSPISYQLVAAKHPTQANAQRSELGAALPQHAGAVRSLTQAQSALLLVILRVEILRAQAGRPAMMLAYFAHEGLATGPLATCLSAISDQVNAAYRTHLSGRIADHVLEPVVYGEVGQIAQYCCQSAPHARAAAIHFMSAIVHSFRSLLCEASCVTTLLEILTLLRRACEAQYDDEVRIHWAARSPLQCRIVFPCLLLHIRARGHHLGSAG